MSPPFTDNLAHHRDLAHRKSNGAIAARIKSTEIVLIQSTEIVLIKFDITRFLASRNQRHRPHRPIMQPLHRRINKYRTIGRTRHHQRRRRRRRRSHSRSHSRRRSRSAAAASRKKKPKQDRQNRARNARLTGEIIRQAKDRPRVFPNHKGILHYTPHHKRFAPRHKKQSERKASASRETDYNPRTAKNQEKHNSAASAATTAKSRLRREID